MVTPIFVNNQQELRNYPGKTLVSLKCIRCGKIVVFKKHSGKGSLRPGIETTFKCRQCNLSDQNKQHPEWQKQALANNIANHGGMINLQTEEHQNIMKDYRKNNPDWHDKTVRSDYRNHGGKHHSQLEHNRERMKEQGSSMGKKSISLFEKRYGVRSPMLVQEFKKNCFDSNRANHGGVLASQTDETKAKIKNSMIDHFGEMISFGSEYITDAIRAKLETAIQNPSNLSFNEALSLLKMMYPPKSRLFYDNEHFDSIPELAVYVYNKDHGVPIIRNHNVSLHFKDGLGKDRTTVPDFIINGRLIEVKGAHFFKPDGTMYCPYRQPGWSNERYDYECDVYNRKYLCGLYHGVIYIIDPSPYMMICMNYLNTKYENWTSFKRKYNMYDPGFIGKGYSPYTMDKSKEYQDPIGRALGPYDINN